MKKNIFHSFKPGTVFNPIRGNFIPKLAIKQVKLQFPSRINAMAIDPSKIASNENMIFTPGEVVFSVKIYKHIEVKLLSQKDEINISEDTKRKLLVIHAVKLMRAALNVNDGLSVSVDNQNELKHSGLGSSSALIASVSTAINELYGNPIPAHVLIQYLAQNHGEEIEGNNHDIQQVQCIGGSAASGLCEGGLLILAGQSKVIASMKISKDYKAVIGIPTDFISKDSKEMMRLEEKNLNKFMLTGKKYGKEIAYRVLHEALPSMKNSDLKPIGTLIFDYRFKMGSIKNCSFVYPNMINIAKKISYLKDKNIAEVLSISSVGPAFFAITKQIDKVVEAFEENNMRTVVVDIENDKYKVLSKIK